MNSCYNDYGDGDAPEFCCIKIRTARKKHKCEECYQPIPAGDKYQVVSGKWDGRLETWKTCTSCAEVREKLFSRIDLGELAECAMACADEISITDFEILSWPAREKLEWFWDRGEK